MEPKGNDMADELVEPALPFIVKYRRKSDGVAWIAMAAFDVEGAADRYCASCAAESSPWEYCVVEAPSPQGGAKPATREQVITAVSLELERHPIFRGESVTALVWATRIYDVALYTHPIGETGEATRIERECPDCKGSRPMDGPCPRCELIGETGGTDELVERLLKKTALNLGDRYLVRKYLEDDSLLHYEVVASLTSLRAALAKQADIATFQHERALAAESSLAAEKLKVAELEEDREQWAGVANREEECRKMWQSLAEKGAVELETTRVQFEKEQSMVLNGADAAEQRVAALVGALTKLVQTATLLHQNAVGCATNHHGNDKALHGLPGWLADAEKDIVSAATEASK